MWSKSVLNVRGMMMNWMEPTGILDVGMEQLDLFLNSQQ